MIRRSFITSFGLAAACMFSVCVNAQQTSATAAPARAAVQLLESAPEDAIGVGQARVDAKPGAPIVVAGKIGGNRRPISDQVVSFIIVDEAVAFCNETGDHGCRTPWDACCEPREKVSRNRATVMFVTDAGAPISGNIKDLAGISELDHVVIRGVVSPHSAQGNLIINATEIYVEK